MHTKPDLPSRTAFKIDQSGYNLPSPSTLVLLLRGTKGGEGVPAVSLRFNNYLVIMMASFCQLLGSGIKGPLAGR